MSEPQTLVVLAETASKEDTTDDAPTAETPPVLRRKGSSANANDPENLEVAEPVPVVAEAFATTPTSVIATNTQTTENATNSTTEESSISVPPIATTAPPWELIPYESWSMLSSIADVGWKANYLLLAQFRKEHGHLHVSDALNAPLAVWMRRQQQMYGDFYSQFEGRCTQRKTSEEMRHMFTKIEMLRAMGVVFAGMQRQFVDPQGPEKMPRSPPVDIIKYVSSGQSTKRKIDWETNLDNLREFRDQHGHCDAEDINLNRWVYRQRKRLRGENGARAAPLTEDEIRRLRDVGVLTLTKKKLKRLARSDGIAPPGVSNESVPKNLSNPERFDEMYEKMKEFYEEHGHTVVPEKKNMKLRGFLVDVRNEYKKIKEGGVSAYLTPIRIERLKQINFSFEARPRHTFDERVEQWLEYRKQSGGRNPRTSSTLGKWVSKTRVRYHDTVDNKVPDYITKEQHHLTEEQIDKLKSLGFDFGERDYSRVVKSWDERFGELLAFRDEHGHVDVPQRYPELGEWVHHQRNRRNTMPKDKVEKLEQIGFKWLTRARPMKRKKLSDGIQEKNRGSSVGDDDDNDNDDMEDEPSPPRALPPHHQPFHRSPQRPLMGFGTPARQWL